MACTARISYFISTILLILNFKREIKLRIIHTILSASAFSIENSSHVWKAYSSQKYRYKIVNKNEFLRIYSANSPGFPSNSGLKVRHLF